MKLLIISQDAFALFLGAAVRKVTKDVT